MKHEHLYAGLSAAVIALSAVPVGIAVFVLGFALGDSPCVMCWEQRIGMLLVALAGVFILRYGPRPKYIGLAVLVAAWGVFMSLRHTAMHAARDIGQGFSTEILGAHTYTWALLVYWVCLVMMGALLVMLGGSVPPPGRREPTRFDRTAILVFLIVVAANIVQAFASTGPPPFVGQSDPVRFSFNPRFWHWSLEEWRFGTVSLRGRWAVEKPRSAGDTPDRSTGPLEASPSLPVLERRRLSLPLDGPPTGLAYDEQSDRFVISTKRGIHLTDGSLKRVLHSVVVDRGYSVDIGDLTGVAFLDAQTVMALGDNKSYIVVRDSKRTDPQRTYRSFLDSSGGLEEVSRGRLTTVRGRMMYVSSLAVDRARSVIYSFTVPNSKTHRNVLARFDRDDFSLVSETDLQPGSKLSFRSTRRSLDGLYITAATFADGRLYAFSGAYSTLLVVEAAQGVVVAAAGMEVPARPRGIAKAGDTLFVLCEDGTLLRARGPAMPNGAVHDAASTQAR